MTFPTLVKCGVYQCVGEYWVHSYHGYYNTYCPNCGISERDIQVHGTNDAEVILDACKAERILNAFASGKGIQ